MNKKLQVLIDDKSKQVTPINRNYYFFTTILFTLINLIVFGVHGSNTGNISVTPVWENFSINNLLQAFVNSFTHLNAQHAWLNMLCFFIAGLYLERKNGSIKFFLFILIMAFFTAFASGTNALSLNWKGYSGVNYGLYGYILIEYIFTLLQKDKRYLLNIIWGAIVVALIYFAMCFNGGVKSVGFEWYPYDLLHNLGHASGFFVGLIFGVYEQTSEIISKYKQK